MYGKFFSSAFTGSMLGAGTDVFALWGYVIANTVNSKVELNPQLLSAILGTTPQDVVSAIKYLTSPDESSRSREEDGRRLIKEGQFQYHVVNHSKYRSIRNEDDRREYNKIKKRESRQRLNGVKRDVKDVIDNNGKSTMSAQAEAEAETKTLKPSKSNDLDFDLFWRNYPKKVDKKKSKKSFNSLTKKNKDKATRDCLTRFEGDDKKYIPNPTTYLNGERWEDETEQQQEKFGAGGI